jgi:hypothetical protein
MRVEWVAWVDIWVEIRKTERGGTPGTIPPQNSRAGRIRACHLRLSPSRAADFWAVARILTKIGAARCRAPAAQALGRSRRKPAEQGLAGLAPRPGATIGRSLEKPSAPAGATRSKSRYSSRFGLPDFR